MASSEPMAGAIAPVVPRRARWFAWTFLIVFCLSGLAGVEAWPFTGWRLFSHLRGEHQVSWRAVTVASDGTERPVPFGRLPLGDGNFVLVMKTFPTSPRLEQVRICDTWTREAGALGVEVTSVRIYRVDRDLLPRVGGRPANPPTLTLRYTCGHGTVSEMNGDA